MDEHFTIAGVVVGIVAAVFSILGILVSIGGPINFEGAWPFGLFWGLAGGLLFLGGQYKRWGILYLIIGASVWLG